MTVKEYLNNINSTYKSGRATEHSYRGYLQTLIESICPQIKATNEPKRRDCGAPDYILTRKNIPIGYIEAKTHFHQRDKLRITLIIYLVRSS